MMTLVDDEAREDAGPAPTDATPADPDADAPQAADGSDDGGADAGDVATRRGPGWATTITAVLAVVGIAVLVLGGLLRHQAATDADLATAVARDQVMVAARTEIATLNTLDAGDIDGGIDAWLAVTTGTLRDQLAQTGPEERELLAAQGKVTEGTVVGAALTDLDADAGTASVIASVEITVRGETGDPALKRNRFSADLVRTEDGWKLETLGQVAVETS